MIPFTRSDRVSALIQRVLSEILRKDIRDPRLKMTTITEVEVSQDLKRAKIYFSTAGGKRTKDAAIDGFNSAFGFIKRTLARELNLRYMPDIKFYYDESLDYGSHIDALIQSVKSENGSDHSTY